MSVFRRAAARRGTPADWLVAGLANPGERYASTRHNVGADAVQAWAVALGCALAPGKRERARSTVACVARMRVCLTVPTTFMNESGLAVAAMVRRCGLVDPARVVIVHDELDLSPGRVKLKAGGGLAGHNGLASVASHLGTRDFLRVRIGVGKPPHRDAGAGWVLSRPGAAERERIEQAIARAVAGLDALVASGLDAAMNEMHAS